VRRVEVSSSAKADIERAAAWYEAQKERLGDRFLTAVLDTIDRISLNPEGYAKVIKGARKAELHRFPYSLFFTIKNDVLVIACLHGKRSPVLAAERSSGVLPMPDPS
jgi:toxin ParE1/3/4